MPGSKVISSALQMIQDYSELYNQTKIELFYRMICFVFYNWAISNNIKFNDSKFQYINFNCSLKESIPRKYLDPSKNIINVTKQVQDLGITLSANCEFKAHINNVVKKCYKLSGWILRTFVSTDRMTMLTLWRSLVLPRPDYCSHAVMESIQSRRNQHT